MTKLPIRSEPYSISKETLRSWMARSSWEDISTYESIGIIVMGLLMIVGQFVLGHEGLALAGAILAAGRPVSAIRNYYRVLKTRLIENWTLERTLVFDGERFELERTDGFKVSLPLKSALSFHTDEHWITVHVDEYTQIVAPSSAFNKEEFRMISLACQEARDQSD